MSSWLEWKTCPLASASCLLCNAGPADAASALDAASKKSMNKENRVVILADPLLHEPGFRSRECHGEEFWGKVGGRSTIGVMILSGWVGVWSVTDHSNCAAIGIPCETVRNRRTNSERS